MNIKLNQAYSFHQIGHRDYQEDSRFPDTDTPSPSQRFFIVCDGVGGCEKGEVASQTVCEAFGKELKKVNFQKDFSNEDFSSSFNAAYDALNSKADDSNREMATTLTFVCFHGGGCTMAHVGDSRIYQIRPSEGIIYRSDDHSMVNSMVHNGVLTPDQAINHPQGNVITRYMEPTDTIDARYKATVMRSVDVAQGDYFFLCTDGVLHNVSDDELIEILSSNLSDEEKIKTIASKSKDSEDNNTAYLISVAEVVTDPVTAKLTELEDEGTHSTKKIKVASQKMEEIGSVNTKSTNRILNWFNNLFQKYMRRFFFLMTFSVMVSSLAVCAQSQKRNTGKVTVAADSTAIIIEKAKKGDAAAQNTLGVWFYIGKDSIKQDYQQALQWWAQSAKQENVDAIGNMAMCYQLGRGTEKDSAMAMKLYQAAIKKGNNSIIPQHEQIVKNTKSIFSSLLLHDCYAKGNGVKKDMKQASHYQEIAAEGGHEASQFALALQYLNNKQADKAAKWFKAAAKQGNVGAAYYYGFLLFNGMGVKQDKNSGIQFLNRASEKGFPAADYQLGKIYHDGNGVEKDLEKAFAYIKSAAYHGNADAKWELANLYLRGEGTAVDYYFATQWFAEVATTTHKKPFNELLTTDNEGSYIQYLMGLRNYYATKDYDEAINCFKIVEKAKIVEGTAMMGLCYANKEYAKCNQKKAAKMLEKAAPSSNIANYYLSGLYMAGTGISKDEKKAIELLKKAADAGIAIAECELGDRIMTGKGVTKDPASAARLYIDAEAQNQLTPQSAKYLAECYKDKLSTLPDVNNAEKRIEKLNKQKTNDNLINLLKSLEQ